MLMLIRNSKLRQREEGRLSGWKIWIFLSLPPHWGPYDHIFQDFIPPHLCATPGTPTQLWVGVFMSMCLHCPPPQCLLVQAECRNVCSSRLILQLWAHDAPSLIFLLFLALCPGIDSDVKRLDTSTRTYCLHCFLCMTLYAVSMLKKKKKRRKNTQQNQSTCFGQKKQIEVVFSVSDSEICCCLSVLLASVWPCFASMRYCPLWRILGEEKPLPRDLEEALLPLNLLRGVLGGAWSRTDANV